MTKLEQLRKQYKNLNYSLIDFASFLDKTRSGKYTPLICKILEDGFYTQIISQKDLMQETRAQFKNVDIPIDGLLEEKLIIYKVFLSVMPSSALELITDLVNFGERGLLSKKDILTYDSIEDIKKDVLLAGIRDAEKNYETQIIKVHEDDTWVVVKPLTYQASIKYGAGTKWCTTSRYERDYFARYWDRGILTYFINKKTGYKFAGYKGIKNSDELSFWNAADERIDSLEIECDVYLYEIIRKIFSEKLSNSDLCEPKFRDIVSNYCNYILYDSPEMQILKLEAPDVPVPNIVEPYGLQRG